MAVDQINIHRLCEDVRRVPLTGPFQQGEVSGTRTFLRPQLSHCEAPDTADANSHAAIGAGLKGGWKTEGLGNGRQAQTLCGPLNDVCQVSLAGAQSN
eukprot:11483607-Alexandrium_andersonii.AAC.1